MPFTRGEMATPYGQGRPKPQGGGAARQLPQRQQASLGNNDPGRVTAFMQGVRDSRNQRAKTVAVMAGAYVGVKAWSAWRTRPRP